MMDPGTECTCPDTHARLYEMCPIHKAAPRMFVTLKAISEMRVGDETNHRDLLALLMAMASITLKQQGLA